MIAGFTENDTFRSNQIREGKSEKEIVEGWQPELEKYKTLRKKYLLYPDFE